MRADVIVLFKPCLDDDLSLPDGAEPFGIEYFPSQRAVEAFVVAVLPRGARIDADRLDAGFGKPGLEVLGNKLRTVV